MEFILINETKLKIMLSRKDLEEYGVRADGMDYSDTETRSMLRDIIDRAKESVGFRCDGMRALVQLYVSRDGGCEMFVSALEDTRYRSQSGKDEYLSLRCLPLYRHGSEYTKKGGFRFGKLEHLIAVCRRLSDIGYSQESSAYIDDNRDFYLFLDGLDATGYMAVDEYTFINEYGSSVNTSAAEEFLGERGTPICAERAVEILSKL